MASLYEIDEQILSCVDMETGEIIDMDKLNELQMVFDDKVEGIALWIKNLLSDADAIKKEKDALEERKKACENKAKNLKEYLNSVLKGQKFNTPKVSISFRKSESIEISDGANIPEEYLRYPEPEVKKTDIKKAIKAGETFEGVSLVQKQNIQIK